MEISCRGGRSIRTRRFSRAFNTPVICPPDCPFQIAKKLKKKQKNVVDEGTKKMREKLDAVKSKERLREDDRKREEQAREAPAALARFFKK